ncbi:MAG: dihydroorotase family protein [Calditrichaeota bacterium]|nr:dihydroorotase family protein [Calditrichota bacterium]
MVIKNARWLTAEGYFEEGHIEIQEGRIVKFGSSSSYGGNDSILNARGCLILPGMIDPHVHFREPGQRYKEGVCNGSKAALKGGVTSIIDMPNNKPPVTTKKRLEKKRIRFAKKSLVNWGIMYHASNGKKEAIEDLSKSVKIYMAKSSAMAPITGEDELKELFEFYSRVSVHAEDESEFLQDGKNRLPHHERRPRKAVISALQKIENALRKLPEEKRPRVVICHINTAEEADWLFRMKNEGFDVWGETCPHYLFFTQEDYLKEGAIFQVNPPIRTKNDRQKLLKALSEGIVDFIGTDHAPHTPEEKQSSNPPSGIAGIEWVLPQMLHLIDEGIINWKQLHQLTCRSAANCYDIEGRDGIKEGNWADLVFVKRLDEPQPNQTVITKTGFNIYDRFEFRWNVELTLVNGIVKFEKGKFPNESPGKAI